MLAFAAGIVIGLAAGVFVTLNNTRRVRREIEEAREMLDAVRDWGESLLEVIQETTRDLER